MATFQSGTNNVLIKVKTKYTKYFESMIRAANLNPGSQVNPADYVQIVGEILAVPRSICNRADYVGYSAGDLKVGDTAIFSYQVIYDIEELAGGDKQFRNQVIYKQDEFWLADIRQVFAVIRKKKIISVNNYVLISEPEPPSKLILPTLKRMNPKASAATVISAPKGADFRNGDNVFVDFRKVAVYQLGEKKFGVLQKKHVLGKEK